MSRAYARTRSVLYLTGGVTVSFSGPARTVRSSGQVDWTWHMESKGSSGTGTRRADRGDRVSAPLWTSRLVERVFILDAPFRSCAQPLAALPDEYEGRQADGDEWRRASGIRRIQKLTFYKQWTCAYSACTSIIQLDITSQFRRSGQWLASVIRSRYHRVEECHDHHRRHRRRPAVA
jgi:hypothetical protein